MIGFLTGSMTAGVLEFQKGDYCQISLICLAGLPPKIEFGGTFFMTTEPAATTEFSPIETPLRMMEREPIQTLSAMMVGAVLPPPVCRVSGEMS